MRPVCIQANLIFRNLADGSLRFVHDLLELPYGVLLDLNYRIEFLLEFGKRRWS